MNEKQKFEGLILNSELLRKHSNNHERRRYIREVINDDLLKHLYINENMSANSICGYLKNFGMPSVGADQIINRLNEAGVITRSISDSCFLPSVISLKLETLQEKYGQCVTNISQLSAVKDKKQQTCLKTYGVDNNFKSSIIKQKIKEYWIKTHGVEHPSEIPGFFKKIFRLSKPHRDVLLILDDLGVIYEAETNEYFKGYNPVLDKRFCPIVDIYIPSKRLVMEVNGCFWHADPKKYKPNDIFNTVRGRMTASQIWQKDKIKQDHIINMNFRFETIWDDEITVDRVKELVNKYENF